MLVSLSLHVPRHAIALHCLRQGTVLVAYGTNLCCDIPVVSSVLKHGVVVAVHVTLIWVIMVGKK